MDIAEYVGEKRALFERALKAGVPSVSMYPEKLHHAIRHSLFDGAKRIRPVIAIAVAESLGCGAETVMPVAIAVEMAHTGSLILDDLPCMDNAVERRGKKACHVVFGEATAILAACSLLDMLYGAVVSGLQEKGVSEKKAAEVVKVISGLIGSEGMVSGQFTDLEFHEKCPDRKQLEFIYLKKTANLFVATVESAAIVCGASAEEKKALCEYAKNLGLAFQLRDDLLDSGKAGEINAVRVCGREKAGELQKKFTAKALAALEPLGEKSTLLSELAGYLDGRKA